MSVQIHKRYRLRYRILLSKESSPISSSCIDDLRSNPVPAYLLQEKGIPWMVYKQANCAPWQQLIHAVGSINARKHHFHIGFLTYITWCPASEDRICQTSSHCSTKPTCLCTVFAFKHFEWWSVPRMKNQIETGQAAAQALKISQC